MRPGCPAASSFTPAALSGAMAMPDGPTYRPFRKSCSHRGPCA
jgi:hypothetical protein